MKLGSNFKKLSFAALLSLVAASHAMANTYANSITLDDAYPFVGLTFTGFDKGIQFTQVGIGEYGGGSAEGCNVCSWGIPGAGGYYIEARWTLTSITSYSNTISFGSASKILSGVTYIVESDPGSNLGLVRAWFNPFNYGGYGAADVNTHALGTSYSYTQGGLTVTYNSIFNVTPVPEPSTMALSTLGLISIALMHHRRRPARKYFTLRAKGNGCLR